MACSILACWNENRDCTSVRRLLRFVPTADEPVCVLREPSAACRRLLHAVAHVRGLSSRSFCDAAWPVDRGTVLRCRECGVTKRSLDEFAKSSWSSVSDGVQVDGWGCSDECGWFVGDAMDALPVDGPESGLVRVTFERPNAVAVGCRDGAVDLYPSVIREQVRRLDRRRRRWRGYNEKLTTTDPTYAAFAHAVLQQQPRSVVVFHAEEMLHEWNRRFQHWVSA
jgi:hypothetical protein